MRSSLIIFKLTASIVVSTAAFHTRVRGSFPGGLKETKMFLPHPLVKLSTVGSLRDREVACSASDLQGFNLEFCVWRAVSSHHPEEVFLAKFSLCMHKSGLKPDSFQFGRCVGLVYVVISGTRAIISSKNTRASLRFK